jgi:hypothetical protein
VELYCERVVAQTHASLTPGNSSERFCCRQSEIPHPHPQFAKTDLQATMAIINEDNLSTIAAFHTQQCIEKSLKALLSLIKISSYRSVLSGHPAIPDFPCVYSKTILSFLIFNCLLTRKISVTYLKKEYFYEKTVINAAYRSSNYFIAALCSKDKRR